MCAFPNENHKPNFDAHRLEIIRIGREANARAGIPDPSEISITPEELQQLQIARGLRPEEKIGSRDLMRMRYGDDWTEDE